MKLSIIIPAYNVEKYIRECLDSILRQKQQNTEIIIINDGSTDKTRQICEQYASKYANVNLYTIKNSGVSAARNLGLDKSTGDYLWFIDPDDYVSQSSIKIISQNIKDAEMLIFGVRKFDKKTYKEKKYINEIIDKNTAMQRILSDNDLMGYLANKIFAKKIFTKHNIKLNEDIKVCEDLLLCIDYVTQIEKIKTINEVLYYYRQRKGSALRSKINRKQLTALCAYEKIYKNPTLNESSKNKASALLIKTFYKYRPLLTVQEKNHYSSLIRNQNHISTNYSISDNIKIIGYRFVHPLMNLLHLKQYKGKKLYD